MSYEFVKEIYTYNLTAVMLVIYKGLTIDQAIRRMKLHSRKSVV